MSFLNYDQFNTKCVGSLWVSIKSENFSILYEVVPPWKVLNSKTLFYNKSIQYSITEPEVTECMISHMFFSWNVFIT